MPEHGRSDPISSVVLMAKTGLSRATLYNYIKMGMIAPPLVRKPFEPSIKARQIGYFHPSVLVTIENIKRYKQQGYSMKEIVSRVTLMKNMPGALFPEWSESDTKPFQNKAHKPNCGDDRRHAGHILLPLSMLVARLQNSASIRSALPPEEYFQLIHQICRVMQRSLQHYGGIQCARGAEAMAGYFLKHNEGSYRMNAVSCALEIKARMSQLNRQWKLRKKWLIDMFLNIGIQEGKEYSGPDHISSDIGFLPFGDIFCVAKRLSEIARDGSILTTKTLLIHLEKIELDQLRYGILQKQGERQVWVEKAYAPITHWIPCANIASYEVADTAAISVAEVLNFR